MFFWQCLRSECSHFKIRTFKAFFMLPATLVLPCDNKRLLGGLKSILGLFPVASDNATSTAQHHRPPQTTSTQATAGHWAHTRAALGTAGQPPPAKRVYIYSTCLSTEKSTTVQTTSTVHNPRSDLYFYLINQFDYLNWLLIMINYIDNLNWAVKLINYSDKLNW